MKFYRLTLDVYLAYARQLDALLGLPTPDTVTAINPVATAPRDASGLLLLAVGGEWPSPVGAVEIDAETYHGSIVRPE